MEQSNVIVMLFGITALALILAVVRSYIHRQELAQRAAVVEQILSRIHEKVSTSDSGHIFKQKYGSLSRATCSGQNFFCDCFWPERVSEVKDENARILRTLNGYLNIEEHSVLERQLALLGSGKDDGSTLLFQIKADGCANARTRTRHGILYTLELEGWFGKKTLIAEGFLPSAVLKKGSHDELLEKTFSTLASFGNKE